MPADELGSARGDVVLVEVRHDSGRPYRITLAGHRFAYDVALLPGSDPPALVDLRLAALDADTPIQKSDLMAAGNIVARLAAIAAKHARRDEPAYNRAIAERMREGLMAQFGVDTDVSVTSYEAPGPLLFPAPAKRSRGRPAKSIEFYRRVAAAAYDAVDDPERRSIVRGVQERAAQWPEINGTPKPTTVERWLKQARKLGLYQGPRTQTASAPTKQTDQENR